MSQQLSPVSRCRWTIHVLSQTFETQAYSSLTGQSVLARPRLSIMGKSQKKRAVRRHNPVRVPDAHLPKGLDAAAASSTKRDAVLPIIQKVRVSFDCAYLPFDQFLKH